MHEVRGRRRRSVDEGGKLALAHVGRSSGFLRSFETHPTIRVSLWESVFMWKYFRRPSVAAVLRIRKLS